MRDELEEWYKAAERNTDGSMVYDILKDWKEERTILKAQIERLTVELDNTPVEHLRNELRASESRHASDSELWTEERFKLLARIKNLQHDREMFLKQSGL